MFTHYSDAAVEGSMAGRTYRRSGFTFVEALTVMTIMGVLFTMSYRSLSSTFMGNQRQAATREVAALMFRARNVAIQRSRTAWFVRSGNSVKVLVDSAGSKAVLGRSIDLGTRHSVTVNANRDTIQFDARGLIPTYATTPKVIVVRGTKSDTLCVMGIGIVKPRLCS